MLAIGSLSPNAGLKTCLADLGESVGPTVRPPHAPPSEDEVEQLRAALTTARGGA